MQAPAGPTYLPVLFSVSALALVTLPELAAEETHDGIKQAISAGLPRYDPAAYGKAQAEKAARSGPKDTPAPLPEAPAASASLPVGDKILQLPTLIIRGDKDLPKLLPRRDPPPKPLKDLQPEPYESAAGRDARLVQKHLTKLQQILLGKSAIAEARAAEFREQHAQQMNELATGIEQQATLGLFDPDALKKIRDEYEKLFYSGPK